MLINVIKDIIDYILYNKVFVEWYYDEYFYLCKLGEEFFGNIVIFERLCYFRLWVNVLVKDVK